MLNNCILTGNLGADPEVFYSSEGEPIATFNMAFRSSKKKTGWIKVTSFHRLAEVTEKYLHKGARKSSFQLIANSIEFIKTDGRGFEEGQGNSDDIPF